MCQTRPLRCCFVQSHKDSFGNGAKTATRRWGLEHKTIYQLLLRDSPPSDMYSEVSDAARVNLTIQPAAGPEGLYNVPVERVVAIYDYDAQGDEELDLRDGDIITVLMKEDSTWWRGELNGKQGMFPRQYVEVLGARV